jgi:hypothetical protein
MLCDRHNKIRKEAGNADNGDEIAERSSVTDVDLRPHVRNRPLVRRKHCWVLD